jgi:hypothetical protein
MEACQAGQPDVNLGTLRWPLFISQLDTQALFLRWQLDVIASAKDTAPVKQSYVVDVSEASISKQLRHEQVGLIQGTTTIRPKEPI